MPLYEDAIGEVIFDVLYFEFSLLMCDNKMVLTNDTEDFKYFTATQR